MAGSYARHGARGQHVIGGLVLVPLLSVARWQQLVVKRRCMVELGLKAKTRRLRLRTTVVAANRGFVRGGLVVDERYGGRGVGPAQQPLLFASLRRVKEAAEVALADLP